MTRPSKQSLEGEIRVGEGEEGGNSYAVKFKKIQEGSKEGTADMWPRRGGAVDREWTRQWVGSPYRLSTSVMQRDLRSACVIRPMSQMTLMHVVR